MTCRKICIWREPPGFPTAVREAFGSRGAARQSIDDVGCYLVGFGGQLP